MTIIQRVSFYTMYHDPREDSVSLQEANRLANRLEYSYDSSIEVIQQYKVSQISTDLRYIYRSKSFSTGAFGILGPPPFPLPIRVSLDDPPLPRPLVPYIRLAYLWTLSPCPGPFGGPGSFTSGAGGGMRRSLMVAASPFVWSRECVLSTAWGSVYPQADG